MKNIKSSKATSGQTSSTASTTTSTTTTVASSPCGCGCGCHEQAQQPCGCCKLTCFERPKYFCGQLLSDADLTLQETYFREKNKLYHRTLDGFGVVCGLRIQCDGHCKGHILIGDGYAIDCCGNDLVVCEPRSFDVIGELRKKKCLVDMPRDRERDYNPNSPVEEDCISKRCFYIGICYAEEPLDFATPYTTECNPAPGPCQPTRIREGVRFEVYEELPVRPNPLDEIEKRIECCFKLYREGQFARGLRQLAPKILRVLEYEGKEPGAERDEPGARFVFEELQAQFLHELRTCPDQYNCNLEHEVYRLRVPGRGDFAPSALEAFTSLFVLIQSHVFSCVLAQLAFPCPPPDPCCVLIGSVEVVNGRLTRVINYPRWYLWCFANFFEVLIYTLANEAACGRTDTTLAPTREPNQRREGCCCPEFEVDVRSFLRLFDVENRAPQLAAIAPLTAIRAMRSSLVSGFDSFKPGGVAPGIFDHLTAERAAELAKTLGIKAETLSGTPHERPDPYSTLLASMIHRGADPLAFFEQGDRVTAATRVMTAPAGPISQLEERMKKLEEEIRTLRNLHQPPNDQQGGPGGNH